MATKTATTATNPDAVAVLRDATTEREALRTRASELRALADGTAGRWVERRETRSIVTATGQVTTAEGRVEPVWQAREVATGERLAAKRELGVVEAALALADEAVEAAKPAAAAAERARRTAAIEAGERAVRAQLPELIADVRSLMERFRGFHEELVRLDAAVGSPYFATQAACPAAMPGQVLDAWISYVRGAFPEGR